MTQTPPPVSPSPLSVRKTPTSAISLLEAYRGGQIQTIVVQRAIRSLLQFIDSLPSEELSQVAAAADKDVLRTLVTLPSVFSILGDPNADDDSSDPLATAKIRGALGMRDLLTEEGGTCSAEEMGEFLGMSRQAVDKKRRNGQLMALELGVGRGYRYPRWQVYENKTLPKLGDVLEILSDYPVLTQIQFFLGSCDSLGEKRPLDCLRNNETEAVLEAARSLNEHLAA